MHRDVKGKGFLYRGCLNKTSEAFLEGHAETGGTMQRVKARRGRGRKGNGDNSDPCHIP